MPTYVTLAVREPHETNWSVLVPDFPEIASVAERSGDAFAHASDAISSAIKSRLEAGEPLPAPTAPDAIVPDAGASASILMLSITSAKKHLSHAS